MLRIQANVCCRFFLMLALAAGFGGRVFAYEPVNSWSYLAYQTRFGLPDNSITGIAQTADGYLWVATKAGLLRFNGKTFAALAPGILPLLPSRAVRAVLRDHRDQLWLALQRGPLFCLKPDGLESLSIKEGITSQAVKMMTEDGAGGVWVVYPAQLRRILNGQVQSIPLPGNLPATSDLALASDQQGNIWCGNGNRLAVWRDGDWQSAVKFDDAITAISAGTSSKSNLWVGAGGRVFECVAGKAPVELASWPADAVPKILFADMTGGLWVGTAAQGLFHWTGEKFEKVPTAQSEITCLFEDQEANLWAGTEGGGLNLIRPRTTAFLNKNGGLPFEAVVSVAEDSQGVLWAVSQDGKLAMATQGRWKLPDDETKWPDGFATSVVADKKSGVWVGTQGSGLYRFQDGVWRKWSKADGLASDTIRSLLAAANGDVWVASDFPNRLHLLREGKLQAMENSTPLGPIRALAESADGTIWIGTAEGQIQRVAGSRLVAEPAISQSELLSVRCLLTTAGGSLWIGYAGDGLGHFKGGKYQRLTTADGLADDYISQLLADDRGYLWINGNRGLSRVNMVDLNSCFAGQTARIKARNYGKNDGLPAVQPAHDNCPSACRSRDGHLWFATHSGLVVVRPNNIQDNPFPPPMQLEQVTVDGNPVAIYNAGSPLQTVVATNAINLCGLTKPLQLAPGHRKLDVDFAALSFSVPEDVRFRYRLSGFDENWVEAGSSHHAIYPRLPAGRYEFRVIACNNSGVWNETGKELRLVVSPFFWETWWFRVGGGVAMVSLAAGIAFTISRRRYRQKLRRLEAKRELEQERVRIARDLHDELGAGLAQLMWQAEAVSNAASPPTEVRQHAAQMVGQTQQLAATTDEIVWTLNPRNDSLPNLVGYLSDYAQQFLQHSPVRCRLDVTPDLPSLPINATLRHNLLLAFKEALHNVVKHAQATEVWVHIEIQAKQLRVVVADNGRGFDVDSKQAAGDGLTNMRERLAAAGGRMEIASQPGDGTKVTLLLRLGESTA